jgi:hypothetical protein
MRMLLTKHRPRALAIACATLGMGFSMALVAGGPSHANAALVGVEVPGVGSVEVAGVPGVTTPSLPTVTTPSLPTIELPPVPEAETPPIETPTTPVETPTVPIETPTTPVHTTHSPSPSGGSGANGSSGHAASVATTTATGSGATRSATTRPRHSSRAAGNGVKRAGSTTPGAASLGGVAVPAAATALVPTAVRTRAGRAHHGSDPLSSIGRHIPLPLPVPDWSKPIILALALLALAFAARSLLVSRRAKRLEGQREALLEDVDAMQLALVPSVPARLGELGVSVAYRPAEGPAAGGDFYDVFALDDDRVALILGDVAGHGHRSLTQAALTRYTVRAYLQAGMEPRAALALAGSVLADPSAEHFATVVVGLYDRASGRLTYASSGHPPPIAIGFEMPEPLTVCCSPPLGWDVQTGRRQTTLAIPAGGGVCFFSDGLLEARTEEGLLGRERLREIVEGLSAPFEAVALLAEVRNEAMATPDDMVACIIAPQTISGSGGQVEELEVDAAAIASGQAERFLAAFDVSERQLESALARARDTVVASDTAVLRLGLDGAVAGAVSVHRGLELPPGAALPSERIRARELAGAG